MARTSAIGLRRDPQPPIPIVMPERSSATTSSALSTAAVTPPAPSRFTPCPSLPVQEGLARGVGHAGEVELEGEALLVPVGALEVDRVDAVQGLLGQPDDAGILGSDLIGDGARGRPQIGRASCRERV